jgi:hypothetical protein
VPPSSCINQEVRPLTHSDLSWPFQGLPTLLGPCCLSRLGASSVRLSLPVCMRLSSICSLSVCTKMYWVYDIPLPSGYCLSFLSVSLWHGLSIAQAVSRRRPYV